MRFLLPLLLLCAAACDDDTSARPPADLAVSLTCGASTCSGGELCCPGACGSPVSFCSATTSCPAASCDLGPTHD